MAETRDESQTSLGLYQRPQIPRASGFEIAAAAASIAWLAIAGGFLVLTSGGDSDAAGLRFAMTALALFLPVGMIWVAATAARASRVMREESQRLQAAVEALRRAYLAQEQGRHSVAEPSVSKKLDEIAALQRRTDAALAVFTSSRSAGAAAAAADPAGEPAADDQATLALGTPAEALAPPLATEDFIRALNFPETAEDMEGFAALRRALADRQASQLVTAAQDVLTLLSQDGIYMDDLPPDMARPEVWRRFAKGERGRTIGSLGGIHDRSSLAISAARMKQDPIFRDAAHHFLRRFDHGFAAFEARASDAEIQSFADTRTARAFMLLGRVAGTFD
ncbi:hypothetical protein [Rhodosalinus sp. K401]|uniref:hypothetical protein n=1 Tax=Rhodosalinus sp. K401 TaxID=3239195 RepID=UPI003526838A